MIARQRMEAGPSDLFRAVLPRTGDGELAAALAAWLGGPAVYVVGSGRGALYHLLSVLPERRIIVPAYTCSVVVEAVRRAGREPIFVDVELDTLNLSPTQVAAAATSETAILATHQFGLPCDLPALAATARQVGALLLEDAAGALGSRLGGALVGTLGAAGILSFESTKTLSIGHGGAIVTRDSGLAHVLGTRLERELRAPSAGAGLADLGRVAVDRPVTSRPLYGLVHRVMTRGDRPTANLAGEAPSPPRLYDARLSPWQERLARSTLLRLDEIVHRRRSIRDFYRQRLQDLKGVALPRILPGADPVLIRFPIRVEGRSKHDFYQRCVLRGVDLAFSFSYTCVPHDRDQEFPIASRLAREILDLPMYSTLTDDNLERIVDTVQAVARA